MNRTTTVYRTLLCLTLIGCVEHDARTTKLAPARLKAPPEMLASAEAYAMALPWGNDRGGARDAWLAGFFEGFVAHAEPTEDADDRRHHRAGQHAGHMFRQARAADLDQLMLGFGYQRVSIEGQLVLGFEANHLRPTHQPGEKWAVHWMTASAFDQVAAAARQARQNHGETSLVHLDTKVRVVAYLSAAGAYGHLGTCSHELRVVTVELLRA